MHVHVMHGELAVLAGDPYAFVCVRRVCVRAVLCKEGMCGGERGFLCVKSACEKCMYVYTHRYVCTDTYIYTFLHTHTHIHIYIHTYIQMDRPTDRQTYKQTYSMHIS